MISDNSLFLWKVYSIMPFLGHFLNSLNASQIANLSVEFHLRLEEVAEETELLARTFIFHSSIISSDFASGNFASLSGMSFFLRYITRSYTFFTIDCCETSGIRSILSLMRFLVIFMLSGPLVWIIFRE